jgi:hypothetical protein
VIRNDILGNSLQAALLLNEMSRLRAALILGDFDGNVPYTLRSGPMGRRDKDATNRDKGLALACATP